MSRALGRVLAVAVAVSFGANPGLGVVAVFRAGSGVGFDVGGAESAIRDLAGNNAASFSAQTVRNDKVSVAITSDPGLDNIYAWNQGDGSADVIEATLTFSEAVAVSGSPELELVIGAKERRASYHSGSGTTALVFQYSVSEGSEDDDGLEVQRTAVDGLVRYASSKAVA